MTGAERKRRWREQNPERERELSARNRADWYARGGWEKDERRKRLEAQAARRQQLEDLGEED